MCSPSRSKNRASPNRNSPQSPIKTVENEASPLSRPIFSPDMLVTWSQFSRETPSPELDHRYRVLAVEKTEPYQHVCLGESLLTPSPAKRWDAATNAKTSPTTESRNGHGPQRRDTLFANSRRNQSPVRASVHPSQMHDAAADLQINATALPTSPSSSPRRTHTSRRQEPRSSRPRNQSVDNQTETDKEEQQQSSPRQTQTQTQSQLLRQNSDSSTGKESRHNNTFEHVEDRDAHAQGDFPRELDAMKLHNFASEGSLLSKHIFFNVKQKVLDLQAPLSPESSWNSSSERLVSTSLPAMSGTVSVLFS